MRGSLTSKSQKVIYKKRDRKFLEVILFVIEKGIFEKEKYINDSK